uniref:Uncharacterized protein n=1 Tax=Arundo donax TaxID=35708 RepID=A0A0A9AJU2_ARUDO
MCLKPVSRTNFEERTSSANLLPAISIPSKVFV